MFPVMTDLVLTWITCYCDTTGSHFPKQFLHFHLAHIERLLYFHEKYTFHTYSWKIKQPCQHACVQIYATAASWRRSNYTAHLKCDGSREELLTSEPGCLDSYRTTKRLQERKRQDKRKTSEKGRKEYLSLANPFFSVTRFMEVRSFLHVAQLFFLAWIYLRIEFNSKSCRLLITQHTFLAETPHTPFKEE